MSASKVILIEIESKVWYDFLKLIVRLGVRMIRIRLANECDAEELLKIYQPYVTDTTISFEYKVPSLTEFRQRITSTLEDYPFLVAENQSGNLLGYAYAHAYNNRPGYAWTAEATIYLATEAKGKGVGSKLYRHLEKEVIEQNIFYLVACITGDNHASQVFHKKLGYQQVAKFQQFAYKLGNWYDIVWMQKRLAKPSKEPLPMIPYSKL
ncbi:GNAT family N-acetyltransferase [uncultured Vagococcus sp.]|uniref:GNAT family N-acetyltransferase n=1 Tax=uncultured Vagococcus sp. TaxID=189676 RepID=UPI0028D047F4|nr:GNAT family N-acetyltransferase [uncultured Vagococcus sp.]